MDKCTLTNGRTATLEEIRRILDGMNYRQIRAVLAILQGMLNA